MTAVLRLILLSAADFGVIAAAVGHYSVVAFIVDEDEGIDAVIFFVRETPGCLHRGQRARHGRLI